MLRPPLRADVPIRSCRCIDRQISGRESPCRPHIQPAIGLSRRAQMGSMAHRNCRPLARAHLLARASSAGYKVDQFEFSFVFNRIDEVAPNAMAFRYMTADLAPQIVGLLAVNVSWDSGHLTPSAEQRRAGWNRVGEFPVSAVVDLPRAHSWPTSYCQNGRFDEWRFRSRTATPTAPARTGHRSRRIGVRHRERVRSCWRD